MKKPTKPRKTIKSKTKSTTAKRQVKPVLTLVMQFEDLGQLTVPAFLHLGTDGKLYLTQTAEPNKAGDIPHITTLKESVAWFKLSHQYNLRIKKGDAFGQWLDMIERALS